jgi:hypothetical protein
MSFINDLMHRWKAKDTSISCVTDIQDKPKLFRLYVEFISWNLSTDAWKGDAEQPELVIFIDEAHI